VNLFPPAVERDGTCCFSFLKSKDMKKGADIYSYSKKIRRTRSLATLKDGDSMLGAEMTFYEGHLYLPWDADFRILGKDTLRGQDCLVVEAIPAIFSDFYLKRWVTWVETENFTDLHTEYFDRKGMLFKVADKEWKKLQGSGHWVTSLWDYYNFKNKNRSFLQFDNWLIDSGLKESSFDPVRMTEEKIWRKISNPPPVLKELSDFPPNPEVRQEFWQSINAEIRITK